MRSLLLTQLSPCCAISPAYTGTSLSRLGRLAEHAQQAFVDLDSASVPSTVVHGDLAPTNVLHRRGMPVGIIDFDLTRSDLVAAELAWTWRRRHDEFLRGFEEVRVLSRPGTCPDPSGVWASALDACAVEATWQQHGQESQRVDSILRMLDITETDPFPL